MADLQVDDDFDVDDEIPDEVPQPSTVVAPFEDDFFHGPMSREEADRCLMTAGKNGSYLLRSSVRHPGDYSLSFRLDGVKHFKIITEMGYFYIGRGCYESLRELVAHYITVPLLNNHCLESPVAPETKKAIDVIAQDIVIALHDYVGREKEQELSFSRGDTLTVLHRDDSGWFWARTDTEPTREGYIPGTMVTQKSVVDTARVPEKKYWFHGMISRPEAEDILSRQGRSQSYLMRESEKSPGDISISFRVNDTVKHFRIETIGHQYKFGRRVFSSLSEIVARYMEEPLTDHLCLGHPVPPGGVSDDVYESLYGLMPPVPVSRQQSDLPEEDTAPSSHAASRQPSMPGPGPNPNASIQSLAPAVAVSTTVGRKPTFQSKKKGKYEKTGAIVRKIKKKWKRMHFALLNSKNLMYFFETETSLRPKGIIDLDSSSVHSLHDSFFGRPNCFQIIVQGVDNETIYLRANTTEERDAWLRVLRRRKRTPQTQTMDGTETIRIRSLTLGVKEAKELPSKASTPYCIVSLDSVMQARTQIKPRAAAFWGEEFIFDDLPVQTQSFTVHLHTRHKLLKDSEIATVTVPMSRATTEKISDVWFQLVSNDGKSRCGQVRLTAKSTDEIVLPLVEYQDLMRALMAGEGDSSTNKKKKKNAKEGGDLYCVRAIGAVGKQRDEIARTLLRVFEHEGRGPELLRRICAFEVSKSNDANTLFRSNSLGSKAMDQFMKMVGMDYLHNTILDRVKDVFESKLSCELDPSRLEKGMDAKANLARLLDLLDGFWSDIERSVERCPLSLRYVIHHLQKSVATKFSDPLVKYTAVSGFIFLRFFCAAILNPKLFNMMPDHPTEHTARTLTLVAKSLQNLANLSGFGAKEPYMKDVNVFITKTTGRMQRFIDDLADMPDYPATTEVQEPIVTARALSAVHRYYVEHEASLKDYAKENPDPQMDVLASAVKNITGKLKKAK